MRNYLVYLVLLKHWNHFAAIICMVLHFRHARRAIRRDIDRVLLLIDLDNLGLLLYGSVGSWIEASLDIGTNWITIGIDSLMLIAIDIIYWIIQSHLLLRILVLMRRISRFIKLCFQLRNTLFASRQYNRSTLTSRYFGTFFAYLLSSFLKSFFALIWLLAIVGNMIGATWGR